MRTVDAVPKSVLIDKLLEAADRLKAEPPLVEVERPAVVVGDLHGDCESLEASLNMLYNECSECRSIVFLGDYVDRGPNGTCVLSRLTDLYMENSVRVALIRGNHETRLISSYYGFLDELKAKYPNGWNEVYNASLELFRHLPYAVVISGRILGLHGGLPSDVSSLSDLARLKKGLIDVDPSRNPREFQILWNDPADGVLGFAPGRRGRGSFLFGPDITTRFLRKNKLSMIIRGHTPQINGYAYYHDGKILSVFTSKFYETRTSVALIHKNGKVEPRLLH